MSTEIKSYKSISYGAYVL